MIGKIITQGVILASKKNELINTDLANLISKFKDLSKEDKINLVSHFIDELKTQHGLSEQEIFSKEISIPVGVFGNDVAGNRFNL